MARRTISPRIESRVCKFEFRASAALPSFLGDAPGSLGVDLDLDRFVCVPVATEVDVRSRLEVALKMGSCSVRIVQ